MNIKILGAHGIEFGKLFIPKKQSNSFWPPLRYYDQKKTVETGTKRRRKCIFGGPAS